MSDTLALARKSSIWLRWRSLIIICITIAAAALVLSKVAAAQGVNTIVAATTLVDGQIIGAADVRMARVTLPAEATAVLQVDVKAVIGRRVNGQLAAGEPVTSTRVQPVGMRTADAAMTIAITDADASLICAGDHIDIYASTGDLGSAHSVVVARGIAVLSVHMSTDRFGRSGSTAVVLADPVEAAALAAHADQPHVSIALRSRTDAGR